MFKLSFDPELYRRQWLTGSGWKYEPTKQTLPLPIYQKILEAYWDALDLFNEITLPLIEVVKIRVSAEERVLEDFDITISVIASHHYMKEEKSEEEYIIKIQRKGNDWAKEMIASVSEKIYLLGRLAIFKLRNNVNSRFKDLDSAIDSLPEPHLIEESCSDCGTKKIQKGTARICPNCTTAI